MDAKVDQSFGDIERTNARCACDLPFEQCLVHRDAVDCLRVDFAELDLKIICVEHRDFAHLTQPLCPQRTNIGPRAHQHAKVAVKDFHAADALRGSKQLVAGVGFAHTWTGQKWRERCGATDRAAAGATAAVRGGKRLVQVVVHKIEAQIAGARDTKDRVEVRAVAIHQSACFVYQPRYLVYVLLKDAERVGVGQHQTGGTWRELGSKILDIDIAARVAFDLDDAVAHHRGGGRVGTVS